MKEVSNKEMLNLYISLTKNINNLEKDINNIKNLISNNIMSIIEINGKTPSINTWDVLKSVYELHSTLEAELKNNYSNDFDNYKRK